MPDYGKMDIGLITALRAHEQAGRAPGASEGISVTLKYDGDLAAIEALGFQTHMAGDGEALGVILFKDLEALTGDPAVRWLATGTPSSPLLDTAVKDIRARASTEANMNAGVDGLWYIDIAQNLKSQLPATGKGVIIAVIDTGIDFTRPSFKLPGNKTRILKIWDQGLEATDPPNQCPKFDLLVSGETYGVEYSTAQIEAVLQETADAPAPPVNHKDHNGHGTHVAGIAAGGPLFNLGMLTGVAPEADIIAVKALDTPPVVHYATGPPNIEVDPDRRILDAVMYCLRTARRLTKSIVINMSFGNSDMPGDGLDSRAQEIDKWLDPGGAADGNKGVSFPKGAIIVKSAGNDGDLAQQRTARIVVPAGGQVDVPMVLVDKRHGQERKRINGVDTFYFPGLGVSFWYRPLAGIATTFAFQVPGAVSFSPALAAGDPRFEQNFHILAGPIPTTVLLSPMPLSAKAFLTHSDNPTVLHPSDNKIVHPGGTVKRCNAHFAVHPRTNPATETAFYITGTYVVRIKAPPGTMIFAVSRRPYWAAGGFAGLEFMLLDPEVIVESDRSATDTYGRHVITVAAYAEGNGVQPLGTSHAVAPFSSRGPLRDFSTPGSLLGPIAAKPDIAAPGVAIRSAFPPAPGLVPGGPLDQTYSEYMQGTSQAAPMVAGVVALMLQKNPALTTTQVRTALQIHARQGTDPPSATDPQGHERAYGAGMVDALNTHVNTP